MTVAIRVIVALIIGLAIFRLVYAIGSSERKAKMRAALDKLMAMMTMTIVIYWLYMIFIWFTRQRGE